MTQESLIDARVPINQCKLGIEALHAHESKKVQKLQESELLPGKEPNIWLNVTVKKMPPRHNLKPVKIPLVHPLIDPRTISVCLITKDPQREYKDLLETHKIKFISRVVGIAKLKGKFRPYEARRMLLKENGLFLADERIIPLLPKLLGVKWFEAKKQPIPVCLTRKDLKGELERAISSTYMNQNKGTCTSIKIGTLSQKPAQILANLQKSLPAIAKYIQDGWENIQALHIKTNSSVSLPIWSCSLDENEGGRWNGLTAVPDEDVSESDASENMESKRKLEQRVELLDKGKKRIQEVEVIETPKKKAKNTQKTTVDSATAKTKKSAIPAPTPSDGTEIPSIKKRPPKPIPVEPTPVSISEPAVKKGGKKETLTQASTVATAETKNRKKARNLTNNVAPIKSTDRPKKEKEGEGISAVVADPTIARPLGNPKQNPISIAVPLTKDELKQKRSNGPGEKKKSKVKSIGSKSIKNTLLGKRGLS